jgi:type III restriction enzyme
LLHHWFGRDHLTEAIRRLAVIHFRYYFCQREAIETLIYLNEVRGIRSFDTAGRRSSAGQMRRDRRRSA